MEPEPRGFLLEGFAGALRAEGWAVEWSGSEDLPAFLRRDYRLHATIRLWRRLGAPGRYQPQSWWEPGDRYLHATAPER